ncbi:uncharacterized protein [Epargyreus clarus]|uniref:uncharacterized protein n=1 Tax=Epargyreus clarus TaxID=520877 RepID=UPI003C308E5B
MSTVREKSIKERTFHVTTTIKGCIKCKEGHTLSRCSEFIKMQPLERGFYVKNNNVCFNCLTPGHSAMECRVVQSCRVCNRRHHSLLHLPRRVTTSEHKEPNQPSVSTESNVEEVKVNTMIASHHISEHRVALLATALVIVKSEEGHATVLKALVDKGSQACFISEKAAQILKLRRYPTNKIVTGMESMKVAVKQQVHIQVNSRWESDFSLPVRAYIMSKPLTTHIPETKITRINKWSHLSGLNLADPDYSTSGTIDLLLGVKEYATMLQEGLIKGPPGTPCAQNTSLGWIIFGEISMKSDINENTSIVMHQQIETDSEQDINMQDFLKRIWKINTISSRTLSKEEQQCEEIYEKTHKRDKTGRYIVKLPFKNEVHKSIEGDAKTIAMNRLLQLERRFNKDPHLKKNTQTL